jgi:hypothetical protein
MNECGSSKQLLRRALLGSGVGSLVGVGDGSGVGTLVGKGFGSGEGSYVGVPDVATDAAPPSKRAELGIL